MNQFISNHGVRLYAVAAALVPLLVVYRPDVEWAAYLPVVAALLGVGELAQRHEDAKTKAALKAVPVTEAEGSASE